MVPTNVGDLDSDGALEPPDVGPEEVLGSIEGAIDGFVDGLAVVCAEG